MCLFCQDVKIFLPSFRRKYHGFERTRTEPDVHPRTPFKQLAIRRHPKLQPGKPVASNSGRFWLSLGQLYIGYSGLLFWASWLSRECLFGAGLGRHLADTYVEWEQGGQGPGVHQRDYEFWGVCQAVAVLK